MATEVGELEALRTVAALLDAAHDVRPHQLPQLVAETCASLGATAARMWLADHGQRNLVNLPAGEPARGPVAIEGSLAGRAFTARSVLESTTHPGTQTAWYPLVDGVDRLGVLEVEHPAFSPATRDAFRHVASIAAAELVTRGQYTDAFTVARRQRSMTLEAELQWQSLPPTSFTAPEVSVAGMIEPAYEAGGDTFDYAYGTDVLTFGILDAVGHDLAASTISALALGTYRNCRRAGVGLVDIGRAIDRVLAEQVGRSAYATGALASLDTRDGTLSWLNGGHPPPLLVRDQRRISELSSPPRLPFGIGHQGGRPGEVATAHLEPGDAVLLYTDGIVEARGTSGEDFGRPRLEEFLVHAFAGGLTPAETVRRLSNAVLDHHGGHLQDDATTLLVVWHPDPTPR